MEHGPFLNNRSRRRRGLVPLFLFLQVSLIQSLLSGCGLTINTPASPSSIALAVSPSPAAAGSPLTATLTVSAGGGSIAGWAAGTVTLLDNGTPIASADLGGSNQAQIRLTTLAPGNHALVASYVAADGVLQNAQSAPVNLLVAAAPKPPTPPTPSPVPPVPVPQPPAIACSAKPSSIDQGSSSTITASGVSGFRGPVTYAYSTTAGEMSWSGATAILNTGDTPAGAAIVSCRATDDNGDSASATTTVMIHSLAIPPAIHCSARPSTVNAGSLTTISAVASSAQGRPLSFTFAPVAGSISGTGSAVTLNTRGVAAGSDGVLCTVIDDRGLSASSIAELTIETPPLAGAFTLSGLTSPATVAESIFVSAPTVPPGASVAFYIDGVLKGTETQPPHWLGGQQSSAPIGFSVALVSSGAHILSAVATLVDGTRWAANALDLQVVPSINAVLSTRLTTYPNHPSAQANSLPTLLAATATLGATLSPVESATRQSVMAMYRNWGVDPSLDSGNDQSGVLLRLLPQGWAPSAGSNRAKPPSLWFSPDAPFYQTIPTAWPRVALPAGYFAHVQLNTARNGDGIGYGEVSAAPSDPLLTIQSQWYAKVGTHKSFPFRMPAVWPRSLPTQTAGDSHMIFIDPASSSFVSSYKTTLDPATGGPDALYAASATPLNSLGDRGGSTAAAFAELPILIQPGEASDPAHPIQHAIGGPLGRTWAARVYPATAWDAGVRSSTNSCTHAGFTNTGLIPYGGVIQLDPKLDLTKLGLTLPALRVLQAMQTYGYYVMDFGCADFDIYTAIDGAELDPYGGLWGYNKKGPGVQNEIERVITSQRLYVVAPLFKKQ